MSAFSSSSASSGTLAVKPCSACAIAKCALGFGRQSFASSRQWTPLNCASKRLQRVTQWMSLVTSVRGELEELVEAERRRLLDLAGELERPRGDVDVGHFARVEHGPLLREVLAGRQPRRVVPGLAHLVFCF